MKNQEGVGLVELFFVLVVAVLIGLAGWYVWSQKSSNDTNMGIQAKVTPEVDKGTAPTVSYSTDKEYCTNKVEQNGYAYVLYQDGLESYLYKSSKLGIEFSYPKQWGAVMLNDSNEPICVGPLALGVGIKGQYGEGDGDLITLSTGYFKKDGKYYWNWFKNDEKGPYQVSVSDTGILSEIPASSGTALLSAENCYGLGCARGVTINLSKASYEGFGISDRRITTEDVETFLKDNPDTSKEKKPESDLTFQDVINELKVFVKLVKVSP